MLLEVTLPYTILGLGLFIALMRTIKVVNDQSKTPRLTRSTYIKK
jgi:hypothetical protein